MKVITMSDLGDAGPMVALQALNGNPPDEFTVFMGSLIEGQRREVAATTTYLIDNLAMECAESAARLQLIGEAVRAMLAAPYMPSAYAIEDCLYPDTDTLAERTAAILAARGVHSSTHRTPED